MQMVIEQLPYRCHQTRSHESGMGNHHRSHAGRCAQFIIYK